MLKKNSNNESFTVSQINVKKFSINFLKRNLVMNGDLQKEIKKEIDILK